VHPQVLVASALPILLIVVTLGYTVACAFWPFAACRRCEGAGKRRSPSGRAWRYCHRCHGTGARLRAGRRAWNHVRRLRGGGSW
jgi:hypothetical protein